MNSVSLNAKLAEGLVALGVTSAFLSMKAQRLDCTGVASLTQEQLDALFSAIPPAWDFPELEEVIDTDTLSEPFAEQLTHYLCQRLGRDTPVAAPEPVPAAAPSHSLDVFQLRDRVIGDYRRYMESFLKIRDRHIHEFVMQELDRGQLWSDPLVQINPAYQRTATTADLVQSGILHPDCQHYFPGFHFYHHQEQAFVCASQSQPYVLTTGTGSGKSLSYVVPIIDDLLRQPNLQGVRAILVYPMNALINSQKEEFDKFLSRVPETPIRVAPYTGQENLTCKIELQNNPPHILLTNYVMLELMLTRTHEDKLVASPHLKFLILDELHTYRGRQGADVALLIRKLRQRCGTSLLCIGTSATMSTKGSRSDRRHTVADVASKLFGVEVSPDRVIDETLQRAITHPDPTPVELRASLMAGLPPEEEQTLEAFQQHPLSAWVEMNLGLEVADGDRHLVRRTPLSLTAGADLLAQQTDLPVATCTEALKHLFLWASRIRGQGSDLAFRLHQFIAQGGSVYATLEPSDRRLLTLEGQYKTTGDRLLYPLTFCRECGQAYYAVRYDTEKSTVTPLLPTAIGGQLDSEDLQEGYLTLDEPGLWDAADQDRLPDSWFRETKRRGREVKKEYEPFIPQKLYVTADGNVSQSIVPLRDMPTAIACWFVPKPFLTCLQCGIVYDRKRSEFTKLSRLSTEGRSTATTLLCLSAVNHLRTSTAVQPAAAKILSFTDNRQDASLQAGHFNDFVQTSFLRASLNGALQTHQQLTHIDLAERVVQQMGLSQPDYVKQVAEYGSGKKRNEAAFLHLIEYRLYEDLRRGWRIVQPNLEQCGLLAIEYSELLDVCQQQTLWQAHPHPILLQATPEQRRDAVKTLLDKLRKELVLDAERLQPEKIDRLKREVEQALNDTWKLDTEERLHEAGWATLESGSNQSRNRARDRLRLTARSAIGRFLRSERAWNWLNVPLTESDYQLLIEALVAILCDSGYLVRNESNPQEIQLRVDCMVWKAQKVQHIAPDPLSVRQLQNSAPRNIEVNRFFQEFYDRSAQSIRTMEGREHTGQVATQTRKEREEKFRQGQLSALFCSPTMELGIDISDLNVVHLRNVPPSPANYAQRSGRAGRGGQGALVLAYASVGSGHDQYFFKRQEQMVAGVVVPPKLELANPDLVKSHVYSIWLAHTGANLGDSMNKILDLELEGYPLQADLQASLTLAPEVLDRCVQAAQAILADAFCQQDLARAFWYSPDWLRDTLKGASIEFDRACQRWRDLYANAFAQREDARRAVDRATHGKATNEEQENAESLEREAQRQINLLVGKSNTTRSNTEFEFYPYRYFATEGFLPGFNFPRLPVRAFIRNGENSEFIARPRVLAIRELAPGNILYYEGNKYQVVKTRIPVGGIDYKRAALCPECGYFHQGDGVNRDTCENCGARIVPDDRGNPAKLTHVFEMDTAITRRRDRITCDEEERLKHGYNVTTHFRYAENCRVSACVTAADGTELLKLTLGETANIWRINRGLWRSQEYGFRLNTATGVWGDAQSEQPSEHLQTGVHLLVSDTRNILMVEPVAIPEDQAEDFLATFQYALERAIQAVYKLEENELTSERLGRGRHLLFWEAAEGGAGVLSQMLENPQSFQYLAQAALDICHFQTEKPSCTQACYECLLSYRNQFDHPLLDRYLVRSFLEQLATSTLASAEDTREQQYQALLGAIDPKSEFERIVLQELYQQGIKLPDAAQQLIPEAKCKPDFIYHQAKVAVFCDGSVHDSATQRERDRVVRENLESEAGYHAFCLRYDEDWRSQLQQLAALV